MINTSQAGHSAGLQFLIIRLGNPKTNGDPMLKDPIDHTNASLSALPPEALDQMKENAQAATSFLKSLSHEGRLQILCHCANGEKSVTELEELLSARQAAVSQQLTVLRNEGLVTTRREGKAIYYRLADDRAAKIMAVLYEMFCAPEA